MSRLQKTRGRYFSEPTLPPVPLVDPATIKQTHSDGSTPKKRPTPRKKDVVGLMTVLQQLDEDSQAMRKRHPESSLFQSAPVSKSPDLPHREINTNRLYESGPQSGETLLPVSATQPLVVLSDASRTVVETELRQLTATLEAWTTKLHVILRFFFFFLL